MSLEFRPTNFPFSFIFSFGNLIFQLRKFMLGYNLIFIIFDINADPHKLYEDQETTDGVWNMKIIIFSIILSIMLISNDAIAYEHSKSFECNPRKITEALDSEKFDSAIMLTQYCIDSQKARLDALEKKYKDTPTNFIDVIGLAEATTGGFLIAKVEILTLKGAFLEAESAILDTEMYEQQHPGSALYSIFSCAALPTARAFLLEKKGDLNGATTAYKEILAYLEEKGIPNSSMVIQGRLAVISLLKNDYASAELWSKNALSSDPAANVVWGALLKKKGDTEGSKKYYAAALKLMNDAKKSQNISLPIYFAEQRRAKDSLGTNPVK
jgi:hypothetical protein